MIIYIQINTVEGERMDPLVKLGATVLGVIVRIASKDENTENVVDGLLQIAEIAENDFFTKRNIDRASQV